MTHPSSTVDRLYPKGHPHFFHVMMGGRPWMRRGGSRIERIYFNQFSVRGREWFTQGSEVYKRQGSVQFPHLSDEQISQFPAGFFDTQTQQWVIEDWQAEFWPGASYPEFMDAAIARRTFAPMLPPAEVRTRDGMLLEPGLMVMFVGGKVLRRHHWNTEALLGRRMVVWCRAVSWHYGPSGKTISYGDGYIKVRERAPHDQPKCWWVVPHPDDSDFLIPGRNVDTTHSWLPIEDPEESLITIDGRRLSPINPPLPVKELILQQ